MSSTNMQILEPMSPSAAKQYRIKDGRVEARVVNSTSDQDTGWWRLSSEQLSNHVRRNTAVARWLERNLGWRRLLWACVGEEPANIVGKQNRQAALGPKHFEIRTFVRAPYRVRNPITMLQTQPNPALEAASKVCSEDMIVPEDELEKLRLTLLHAYEKPKPLPRRIIEAIRHRTRTPKKAIRGDSAMKAHDKDAA